jgi:ornithine carbamoyltransferase
MFNRIVRASTPITSLRAASQYFKSSAIISSPFSTTGLNNQPRSLISLKDLSGDEISNLLDLSADLKKEYRQLKDCIPGTLPTATARPLEGKSMAMIFQKRSTRTRVSTETGFSMLGGHPLFLGSEDIQLGTNESLLDTARVLSRFNSILLARVYAHSDIVELARESSVPVINALSDMYHPLQILADLLTLRERYGNDLKGLKVAWVGDGNNITHSLMVALPKLGIDLRVATPTGYEPNAEVIDLSVNFAKESGSTIHFTTDPLEAVQHADVVVTDTWVSMGQEDEYQKRMSDFAGYQVTREMMSNADPKWTFLHCLPRKPQEVDDDVFYDEKRSLVWDEAENRMWTVMAVVMDLLQVKNDRRRDQK